MKTFPLSSLAIGEAQALQFRIVDAITHHFSGVEILTTGDLGVVPPSGHPKTTRKAERVFAEVFDAEDAILVRGAGTGAIRWALISSLSPMDTLLVHKAPIYPTTAVTLRSMCIQTTEADFNHLDELEQVLEKGKGRIKGALVQHTRQKPDDAYDFGEVIGLIKNRMPDLPVITDDNYAALKVKSIGNQAGADLATFSCFKTLGPEGVGVILGKHALTQKIRSDQYSGGSQVQGHEAMRALRGMVYAPVALAVQAQVSEELVERLRSGEIPEVEDAFLANAQSKVVLVKLKKPIAKELLMLTPKYGAASHPVGSESIYEFAPMIYRVSGTFLAEDPSMERTVIRINPMRSGAETILSILKRALGELE